MARGRDLAGVLLLLHCCGCLLPCSTGSTGASEQQQPMVAHPARRQLQADDQLQAHPPRRRQLQADDPVRRWLADMVITLPLISFVVKVPLIGDVNATLENLVCEQLALGAMSADDTCSETKPQIAVDARGVGVSCTGDWAYHELKKNGDTGGGAVSVHVEAPDLAEASFQLSLDRSATGARLVAAAHLDVCKLTAKPKLKFQGGGALNGVLKIFTGLIEDILPGIIQTQGCKYLSDMVATNLTGVLAEINTDMAPFLDPPALPPAEAHPAAGRIDLREAALTGLLGYAVDRLVAPQLNKLLGDLSDGTGEADLVSTPISLPLTIPDLASLDLTVTSLHIGGLNSWRIPPGPNGSQMFETVGPETMAFRAALAKLEIELGFRVGVHPLNGTIKAGELIENGTLTAKMTAFEISTRINLGLNEAKCGALSIPERRTLSCVASVVDAASLNATRLNFSFSEIALSVVGEGTERDLDEVIDAVFHLATCAFDKAIAPFVNAFLVDPVATLANTAIVKYIGSAEDVCVEPPEEVPEFGWGGTIVAAVLYAATSVVSTYMLYTWRNSMKLPGEKPARSIGDEPPLVTATAAGGSRPASPDRLASAPDVSSTKFNPMRRSTAPSLAASINSSPMTQADLLNAAAERGGTLHTPLVSPSTEESESDFRPEEEPRIVAPAACLGVRDTVPGVMQYVIPALLLLNAALFLSSNTSSGASVAVVINLSETRIETGSLFDFALTNSVKDMWEAKVYPLSLLIAVFSGFWPYCKIGLLLACWWAPRDKMSAKVRERILMAVDALGKWSLIDAYVLVLLMVAFSFHLELNEPGQLQPPSTVDVFVNPERGFYLFIIATILSLILTHVLLHYERGASVASTDTSTVAIALRDHASRRGPTDWGPLKRTSQRLEAWSRSASSVETKGTWRDAIVTPALVASIVLQVIGASVSTFRFTFGGLAAYALDLIDPSTIEASYSLLSLGARIPAVSDPASGLVGPTAIEAVFYTFAFVTPLVQLIVLLILWFLPLRLRRQYQLFVAAEILHAWSGLEVFVVSILAALLEIRQFVEFIVAPYCGRKPDFGLPIAIDTALEEADLPELLGDNTCFDVSAELEAGCWLLFAASVLSVLVSRFVLHACHSALESRGAESSVRSSAYLDNAVASGGGARRSVAYAAIGGSE